MMAHTNLIHAVPGLGLDQFKKFDPKVSPSSLPLMRRVGCDLALLHALLLCTLVPSNPALPP